MVSIAPTMAVRSRVQKWPAPKCQPDILACDDAPDKEAKSDADGKDDLRAHFAPF